MTAPDPGLTDLIAAHLLTRGWSDGIEVYICLECGDEWWTASEFAEHVKVLAEQHTNGRITNGRKPHRPGTPTNDPQPTPS